MNERIEALIKQCTKNIEFVAGQYYDKLNAEKFAELIVKECCELINATSQDAIAKNTYMGDDVPSIVHIGKIEKHFGIK